MYCDVLTHLSVFCFPFTDMGWSPIFRDIVMGLGIVSVSHESCKFVLTQQGPGHSVAIVVGGSPEVLTMFPGSYILTLERRRGFIKLALETGYLHLSFFRCGMGRANRKEFVPGGTLPCRGGSRGGAGGAHPPFPWDHLRFSNTTGILPKKNYVVYWCWSRARDECTPF